MTLLKVLRARSPLPQPAARVGCRPKGQLLNNPGLSGPRSCSPNGQLQCNFENLAWRDGQSLGQIFVPSLRLAAQNVGFSCELARPHLAVAVLTGHTVLHFFLRLKTCAKLIFTYFSNGDGCTAACRERRCIQENSVTPSYWQSFCTCSGCYSS